MKVLGLDLSTKTGWSVLDRAPDGSIGLVEYGRLVVLPDSSVEYPFNMIECSKSIANKLSVIAELHSPNAIIIEETNKGKNRFSQKQLEFIHFAVAEKLRGQRLIYVDTSAWRKTLNVNLNGDELQQRKDFKTAKRERQKQAEDEVWVFLKDAYEVDLKSVTGKRDQKRIKKAYDFWRRDLARESLAYRAVKKEGQRIHNVSKKDASVRRVNEIFCTNFELHDHDICDSICLCAWYYQAGDKK